MTKYKAFTIIETIFVIMIIGILALVSIPKLSSTYDDARVAIAINDIGTLINDVTTYYTSYDRYSSNLEDMSNIKNISYTTPWDNILQKGVFTYYTLDNSNNLEPCVNFSIENRDGNLTIYQELNPNGDICKILQSINTFKSFLGTRLIGGNRVQF